MSTLDDLSALKAKPFGDAVNKLEELMTQNGRAFLLGAGCSKCAGLPLTAQLTSDALASPVLDSNSKEILTALQANFAGAASPNIEDYLSELVDLLAIADRRAARSAAKQEIELGGKTYSATVLRNATEQIKQAIAKVIDVPVAIETHWKFVKAVHRPVRPGKATNNHHHVDYLVLNYDTLIEDALALERVVFADGLDGGVTGWWDAATFSENGLAARVLKLHGSINWCQFPNETMPRRVPKSINAMGAKDQRIVIWPASTKYRETQYDPYAQLAALAREVLRPRDGSQRVVAICGYRFGDSHINIELDKALRESRDLTIVVFWSEEALDGQLKQWHDDVSAREQVLIYGRRGFWHGDTIGTSAGDLPWWKFENITRLLGGER